MTTNDTPGWQLVVGRPFIYDVSSWPYERFEYRIFGDHHMLQICMSNLAERDVAAFHQGQVNIGTRKLNSVWSWFVLFRVAGFMEWSDRAYSHHQVKHPEDRELPPQVPGMHQVLLLVLVESETGFVRGLRVVTWSRHASVVFDRILREQIESPFDAVAHARRVHEVYSRYPRTKDLLRWALHTERAEANL